jgi:hypothetical protein
MSLYKSFKFSLGRLRIFPGEDGIQVSSGEYCGIREKLIEPFNIGKMNFLHE